jgi:hypothetical protein
MRSPFRIMRSSLQPCDADLHDSEGPPLAPTEVVERRSVEVRNTMQPLDRTDVVTRSNHTPFRLKGADTDMLTCTSEASG